LILDRAGRGRGGGRERERERYFQKKKEKRRCMSTFLLERAYTWKEGRLLPFEGFSNFEKLKVGAAAALLLLLLFSFFSVHYFKLIITYL
jgi:hypothetical protein